MKKNILVLSLIFTVSVLAQEIPSANIIDLKGKKVEFKDVIKSEKPVIVSFWATWCVPCINELDAISEVYPDWQEETGVKLIAISTDDDKTARRIVPLVNGRGWEYDVYRDYNGELKRALNFPTVPFLIVIKNGKIVFSKSSYTPGSEEDLYKIISE